MQKVLKILGLFSLLLVLSACNGKTTTDKTSINQEQPAKNNGTIQNDSDKAQKTPSSMPEINSSNSDIQELNNLANDIDGLSGSAQELDENQDLSVE